MKASNFIYLNIFVNNNESSYVIVNFGMYYVSQIYNLIIKLILEIIFGVFLIIISQTPDSPKIYLSCRLSYVYTPVKIYYNKNLHLLIPKKNLVLN